MGNNSNQVANLALSIAQLANDVAANLQDAATVRRASGRKAALSDAASNAAELSDLVENLQAQIYGLTRDYDRENNRLKGMLL